MKCGFLLSKENLNLAKEEIVSLLKLKQTILDGNLLIAEVSDTKLKLVKRLAYTKTVYQILFDCTSKTLEKKMKEFDWQKVYDKNFSLRFWRHYDQEVKLAGYIWNNVKKPKVNLKNAKTQINIFQNKKTYCCLLISKQKQDFEKRKPHLRPGFSPISLPPKLARCLVNLTGIEKGTIIDPFCGTGGILIEAGLMGLKVKGYDIEQKMLEDCETNLKHFKIKDFKLLKKNALSLEKTNYVVTDLPYGRNTKKQNIEKLYSEFLKILSKKLGKRVVMGLPSFIKTKKYGKLKLVQEFSYYLHKSLTKKIVVLEK